VIALYLGVTQPRDQARGIASEKASGLAAVSGGVGWEPISLWRQTSILPHLRSEAYLQKGIVGGVSVDRAVVAPASLMTFSGGPAGGEEGTAEDRKLARTDSRGLIVKTPAETAEKIIQIALRCRRIPSACGLSLALRGMMFPSRMAPGASTRAKMRSSTVASCAVVVDLRQPCLTA